MACSSFDPDTGWVDFVVPVSRAERLWEGAPADDQVGTPITEFVAWLSARRDRSVAGLGAPVPGVARECGADRRGALAR